MKARCLSAVVLVSLFFPAPAPAVTFEVVKASASVPAFVEGVDRDFNNILIRRTFSTKALINIALGRDLKAKVARNEVLGAAGDRAAVFSGNSSAAVKLVVVDTNSDPNNLTVLGRLLVPDGGTPIKYVQNFKTFQRVGVGRANVQATNGATFKVNSGVLQVASSMKRKPTPSGPTPIISAALSGSFNFTENGVTNEGVVLAGKFTASGKALGFFTEP